MGWKEGKEPIREALSRLDLKKDLVEDLEAIWNEAERRTLEAQKSPIGHGAGLNHCLRVETNISRLIPDEWKGTRLNAVELFLLSAAACLHDNGKIDPSILDHGIASASDLREHYLEYKLDKMHAELVASIVEVHTEPEKRLSRLEPIRHIGLEKIHLRELAVLLCLADTMDCDYRRVLKGALDDPVTQFRRQISGCYFDPQDGNCICVESVPKNFDDEELFWKCLGALAKREVEPICQQLAVSGYPSKLKGKVIETYIKTPTQERQLLPGLDFYHELDEGMFKGRDEEVKQLRGYILNPETPITLLFGKAGVGKTSLICAGLFPKLTRTGWLIVRSCPSFESPPITIAKDIWRVLLEGEAVPRDINKVLEQVDRRYKNGKLLVVLDQFEETLKASPDDLAILQQVIVQVLAERFPALHFLIAYQSEAHAEIMHFLQSISISVRNLPQCPVPPLSREGAKEAFTTLFTSAQIGIDPTPTPDGASLVDLILDDINTQGQGFYPPYLQIVAVSLTDIVRTRNKIITYELYKELRGAATIIGRFLLNQLGEFGSQRKSAENILKALVGEGGFVRQRSLEEIQKEVKLKVASLLEVLNSMRQKRLIRLLQDDLYEVIHSYLANLVYEELVGQEERELKRLRDRLFMKSREYSTSTSKDFLSTTDLARLYAVRDQITPDNTEAILLLHCCLAETGPGWYWFKNAKEDECLPIIENALSHEADRLRKNAIEMVTAIKGINAVPELRQMLQDPKAIVKKTAVWAIGNVKAQELLPELKVMLKDQSPAVREAAVRAIGKLGAKELLEDIRKLINTESWDKYWEVRCAAVEVIGLLGGDNVIREFRELLKHPDRNTRAEVVKFLAAKEGPQILPQLRAMLLDNKEDWAVKREVVRALIRLKDEESLKTIANWIYDKDWGLRDAAVEAKAIMAGGNALRTLTTVLRGNDPYTKMAAIRLIVERLGQKSPPLIVSMLNDRNSKVRIAAIHALTRTDGKETLKKLMHLLRYISEKAVCEAAARGIGELGTDEDAMKLAQMLTSLKFGEQSSSINDALIRLDKRLFCPFESNYRLLYPGRWSS